MLKRQTLLTLTLVQSTTQLTSIKPEHDSLKGEIPLGNHHLPSHVEFEGCNHYPYRDYALRFRLLT